MLFTDCFHPLDASIVPKPTQIYIFFANNVRSSCFEPPQEVLENQGFIGIHHERSHLVTCDRMMLVMNETMAMATAVAVATNAFCSIIVLFFKNYELHEWR